MTALERTLTWPGAVNGRDLADLALPEGRTIRPGRLCRSAAPHSLTPEGWQALVDHGIRSIVDLRTPIEISRRPLPLHLAGGLVTGIDVPLEADGYADSWADRPDRWKLGSPHYYEEFLADHRATVAAALAAVAGAADGGVLVHCGAGRDRCGLVVAMALDLVGVDHDQIVADHWLSYERDQPVEVELGLHPVGPDGPPLTAGAHATALRQVLARHPARSCFDHPAEADRVRARLLARL